MPNRASIAILLLLAVDASAEKWRLTIDDGPNKYTLAIAQRLKGLKCPATFFVCGSLYPYREDLKWIVDNGFGIGNHSRSHKYETMRKGGYREIKDDLVYVNVYMKTNFGVSPREFRAPYGAYGNTVMCVINGLGLVPGLWTSGVGDCEWAEPGDPRYDPEKIFEIACTVGRFPAAGRNVLLIHSTRWELYNIDALVGAMRKHGEIVLEF
jgi:peptidoglycan/xylan/chitin deacetylase (PgdA/CDA1 family)